MSERELPMLAGVAAFLAWCEELLSLLNGPLLMLGAGIAVVDLLTDGALTAAAPALLFAWAISQALGIDIQLLATFARARDALRIRAGWSAGGWLLLGAILAYFGWQAGYVFAVQQAEHVTEARALAQLGIPAALWLGERAALAVGLVALSGWTRYHPPAKVVQTGPAEDAETRRLRQEAEVAEATHRVRMQAVRAAGLRQGLQALRGRVDPLAVLDSPDEMTEPEPPDGTPLPAEAGGDTGPQPIPASRTIPRAVPSQVPPNRITAAALRAWLLGDLSIDISEDEAIAFIRAQPTADRLIGVQGRPWVADKAPTKRAARNKWEDRASLRLTAG